MSVTIRKVARTTYVDTRFTVCDQCQKEVETGKPDDFITSTVPEGWIVVVSAWNDPNVGHPCFCSWECVVVYATAKRLNGSQA